MEEGVNIRNRKTVQNFEEISSIMSTDYKTSSNVKTIDSPMIYKRTTKKWSKMKIIVACFLVPIRLLLLMIAVSLCGLVSTISLLGYSESDPPKPIGGCRRIGLGMLYLLCNVIRVICGFYVNVKGTLSPEARLIVTAPHSCIMDGFIIGILGHTVNVIKSEIHAMPIFGNMSRLKQAIFVDRVDKESKKSAVKEIKRRVHCKEWPPMLIFPEGITTNGNAYTFFKAGAFYPGLPVQPVIFRYLDSCGEEPDYTWPYIAPGDLYLLLFMLSRLYNRLELEILPLYVPTQDEINDPFTYARNVRDYFAKVDNKPTTDHSFEDYRLMDVAKELNLPMEVGSVEYYKVKRITGMDCDRMIECLGDFARINQSREGVIHIEEFSRHLNLSTSEVKSVFRMYGISSNDFLSFQQYLIALFLISKEINTETIQYR